MLLFQPSVASVARMKLMSAPHTEEPVFNVKTVDSNLVFSFLVMQAHMLVNLFSNMVLKGHLHIHGVGP